MREFVVGVFEHPGKRTIGLMAYTRYYSATWPGCCEHRVTAINGTAAKRLAQDEHRAKCMPPAAGEE